MPGGDQVAGVHQQELRLAFVEEGGGQGEVPDFLLEDGCGFPEKDRVARPVKLDNINKALKGTPFEVSYRVLNELTIMIGVMLDDPAEEGDIDSIIDKALDRILLMKILPRIEGDVDIFKLKKEETIGEKTCHNRLEWLMELAPNIVTSEDKPHQQTAREKIQEMIERLDNQEFTRFWP